MRKIIISARWANEFFLIYISDNDMQKQNSYELKFLKMTIWQQEGSYTTGVSFITGHDVYST